MENTFPGTEDVLDNDDLRSEIVSRYRRCENHYQEWMESAEEDYKFALGEQWSQEELQTLKNQNRPALTFNRIKPLINLIAGYQRENSARLKVHPEGGEDKVFSEVMDKTLSFIDKNSKLAYKLGYLFDDGLYCGKGYIEAVLDYSKDPIRGDLKFIIDSPYGIYVDPDNKEYDLNEGAEYVIKTAKFTKIKLKDMFPHKKRVIEGFKTDNDDKLTNSSLQVEGDDDNYGNNPNRATVTIDDDYYDTSFKPDEKYTLKEYWRKKRVTKYFVVEIESGEPRKFESEEDAQAFIDKQGGGSILKREVKEMWVAAMVCGYILQDVLSPFEPRYSGFPIFQFIADWAPNASNEKLRVQGITRSLIDPQKEKNKAKSNYLHILSTQSNSGWIGDTNALTEEGWKSLENMGSTPGITIKKKRGTELTQIQPQMPSQSNLVREQTANEEFKQISNVNPDLLGQQDGTTSGRAISLRIKQAVLALVRIFSNYRYTKEILGKFTLEMIPEIFDDKRILKVIGPQYRGTVKSEQYPEGLTDGTILAFLQMVKDNKYDVEVTESDSTQTSRYEVFEQLTELAKSGYPIPPTLLVKYLDIQNSDEVIKEIEKMQQQQLEAQQQKKQ